MSRMNGGDEETHDTEHNENEKPLRRGNKLDMVVVSDDRNEDALPSQHSELEYEVNGEHQEEEPIEDQEYNKGKNGHPLQSENKIDQETGKAVPAISNEDVLEKGEEYNNEEAEKPLSRESKKDKKPDKDVNSDDNERMHYNSLHTNGKIHFKAASNNTNDLKLRII